MRLPLIPKKQYKAFGELESLEEEEKNREIKKIIESMPKLHQRTLKFCAEFFSEVVDYEEFNRMTAYNIAVTVGPNIFRSDEDKAEDILVHGVYYDVFIRMILNYEELFTIDNHVDYRNRNKCDYERAAMIKNKTG